MRLGDSDLRPQAMRHRKNTNTPFRLIIFLTAFLLPGCSIIETAFDIAKGTVKGGYYVVKGAYHLTAGTTKVVYHIGKFTFEVLRAPMEWPLTYA